MPEEPTVETPRQASTPSRPVSRWALALAALLTLFGIGIWATTPPAVTTPAATIWASCFDPIALPVLADASELALVRHKALDAPLLMTNPPQATRMQLVRWHRPVPAEGTPSGQTITLRKGQEIALPAAAAWTATLEKGSLELRRTDGSRFLVEPRARFGLHPTETYTARLDAAINVIGAAVDRDGRVDLPPEARIEIVLPEGNPAGTPIFVRQTERLLAGPLVLPSTTSPFAPEVRPDRETAPYLAMRVSVPGLDLDPTKRTLRACLWLGEDRPQPIAVSRVGTSGPGAAQLALGLPSESFSWFDSRQGRRASVAVAATDGTYAARGDFVYPSKFWALVLATVITVGLVLGLVGLRGAGERFAKRWFMGLFLGEDGQPSLSLLQILLWTVVTVWSLLFVFFGTFSLLTMTQQVMVLLGFAGAGSLAARWVALRRPRPAPIARDDVRFWALLENNGTLDLFKLQLFLFTVLIALFVVFRVVQQSAFPSIDPEFLLLMGVSNGLYVGSKIGQSSALDVAQQRKLEWDALRLQADDLEKRVAELDGEQKDLEAKIKDPATAAATKQKLTDKKAILDKDLVDKKAALAQSNKDRDAKGRAFKKAMEAATKET